MNSRRTRSASHTRTKSVLALFALVLVVVCLGRLCSAPNQTTRVRGTSDTTLSLQRHAVRPSERFTHQALWDCRLASTAGGGTQGLRHPRFPAGASIPIPVRVDPLTFTPAQQRVVKMMHHAWTAYRQYAWGFDELVPTQFRGRNWDEQESQSGLGVTVIEALDTLWLFGMQEEFEEALRWLESPKHSFDRPVHVSLFETTIRVLGGLLSAYELSGRPSLLDKGFDLGRRLLCAWPRADVTKVFDAIPKSMVDLRSCESSHPGWMMDRAAISEVASLQLEFSRLSYFTGHCVFDAVAQRVMDTILAYEESQPSSLYAQHVERSTGKPLSGTITLGSRGDSFYEYVAKQAILTNFTDGAYVDTWSRMAAGIADFLTVQINSTHAFVAEAVPSLVTGKLRREYRMDHLACFIVGPILTGTQHREEGWLHFARSIGRTCVGMYDMTPTGLAPDIVVFSKDTFEMSVPAQAKDYSLRPETLEALFYLTRFEPSSSALYDFWTSAAERILHNIETQCRVNGGYVGLKDATVVDGPFLTVMETYFVAETLKYGFLALQARGSDVIPLDEWVFNTEGHPFRRMSRPLDYTL